MHDTAMEESCKDVPTLVRRCVALEAAKADTARRLDEALERIQALETSTCWRITAPIRTVKRVLFGLRTPASPEALADMSGHPDKGAPPTPVIVALTPASAENTPSVALAFAGREGGDSAQDASKPSSLADESPIHHKAKSESHVVLPSDFDADLTGDVTSSNKLSLKETYQGWVDH
ncbi:hypothetical protein CI15_01205 [Paraburkholderia monticola]|uniref:Uncharacterized protein n=1 Tax=Paraburkholderia monticola TaxID=1399968 RepID=A0A149Q219_9BURK|nr:hypothetical protein [Paraburkholderia monticola]KXU91226.1 hypothetical protein CI15_01205 [Paraburkholderia monticola]